MEQRVFLAENGDRISCRDAGCTLLDAFCPFIEAKAKAKTCLNVLEILGLVCNGSNSSMMGSNADWHIYGITAFQTQLSSALQNAIVLPA